MKDSLGFLLGVLARSFPAYISAEDFAGRHGPMLRRWQKKGWLAVEPGRHPVPSCPHCLEGIPISLLNEYRCSACHHTVDACHLLLWPFRLEALLVWLARSLDLIGDVRRTADGLWHLGRLQEEGQVWECFFAQGEILDQPQRQRLLAYRQAILIRALPQPEVVAGFRGPCLSLHELLWTEGRSLRVVPLSTLLRGDGNVRFEEMSGSLWVGERLLGEVPVGSKEHALLHCLSERPNEQVAYADIKQYVLQRTNSSDTTEEATFCHRLKSRIKKRWIPQLDRLVVTANKGEGYRLRTHLTP